MAEDRIRQIAEKEILNERLGFLPTSGSVKPVHVANGLFRRCLGLANNIAPIHEWVTSERRKGDSIHSSEELMKRYKDIFLDPEDETVEEVSGFRFLLEEIFDQDKAGYPSLRDTVLNISSHWLVKDYVKSESGIDSFIYNMLSKKVNGKKSLAISQIQEALKKDDDDLTKLIKPIAIYKRNGVNENRSEELSSAREVCDNRSTDTIRKAFDTLAENMQELQQDKSSLLVLQRFVNMAGFAAIFYLFDIGNAIYGSKRVPILLDGGTDGLEAVQQASEQCLIMSKKAVEEFFINSILEVLKEETVDTEASIREYIKEMSLDETKNKANIRNELEAFFDNNLKTGMTPQRALAHSLQLIIYTYLYPSCTPSDFCSRGLSIRLGLVGPYGNAAKRKRFLINRFLLETLVLSVLNKEQLKNGVELRELGDSLRKNYNILIGSDVEKDFSILQAANIAQGTPGNLREDLSQNSTAIAEMLISMRLAKKYADGVTIVGWEG